MMYRIFERGLSLKGAALALFCVAFLLPSVSSAQSSTDAKLWTGFVGRTELTKPLRIDVEHQQRFSSDNGAEKMLTEFKLRYRAHKLLRVGAAYRLIGAQDPDGFWHRVSGDVGTGYEIGKIELAYRLRFQSTIRPTETVSALRNKLGAEYGFGGGLSAGGAAELHYSTSNSEFREIRLVASVDKRLNKKIKVGAFYMYQNEFNKNVEEYNHIFGVGMTYTFRRARKAKTKKADPVEAEPAMEESAEETSDALDL
jgi:hypothetical protein